MEKAIKEGALRLLTSETSCDVIISCQGCRLMAHRIILSIASPVLQDLLRQETTEPAVLIFPDINGSIMSLILDYIYTGTVAIYSNTLQEFLGAANLLKLYLDLDSLEAYFNNTASIKNSTPNKFDDFDRAKCRENDVQIECHNFAIKKDEYKTFPGDFERKTSPVNKTAKRIPNLMPISSLQTKIVKSKKGLYNTVIPSPWCPRVAPLLADPRTDCLVNADYNSATLQPQQEKIEENDTNNNFQILPTIPLPTAYFQESLLKTEFTSKNFFPKIQAQDRTSSPNEPAIKPTVSISPQPKKQENEKTEDTAKIPFERAQENNVKSAATKNEQNEQNKNEKQKPFKCNDCGKCFSQLRNYKYHRSVHEGTKEFAARCPECGKVFNDRGYLSSHLKIHRDRKEYACPHCPKRFNQRVAYNMHLRIHTGVKPHECLTCGKSFSRKMLLKQHQRVHTGERPYSCPECGKSFADRSNMSLHARLHTGVKPYACNLCPKSFTKKHHLKTHMNFHTGLKPYSCQNCGLAFSQSSNMRTHYKKCILKSSTSDETSQNAT